MKIKEIGEKIKIGIDKIGFAMPKYFLDIRDLAIGRNENANKFVKGLMQSEMSIAPVTEDIVALGASAAEQILDEEDKKNIEMVIVGTESGIDQSKASAVFIHNLLEIQPFARCIEIKEACYGATAALNFAKNYIEQNENASVLVIASDIAKYGIDTPGESTQGAGSIAMLIKKEPRIAVINDESICQTRDIMDFWRPNYSDFPIVDGHFSTKQYLDCLTTTFEEYTKRYNQDLSDFDAFCFHLPFPKLGLKAINSIFAKKVEKEEKNKFLEKFHTNLVENSSNLGFLNPAQDENLSNLSQKSGEIYHVFIGAGAGIVWDSKAQNEYAEICAKRESLVKIFKQNCELNNI